jgi:hypothetical protein
MVEGGYSVFVSLSHPLYASSEAQHTIIKIQDLNLCPQIDTPQEGAVKRDVDVM